MTKVKAHYISILNKLLSLFVFLGALIYFLIEILSHDISLSNRFLFFQIPFILSLSILIIIYIVYLFGNYFSTHITVNDNYIKLENSFIVNNSVVIPFINIHSYMIKQSILYKPYKAKRIFINSGSINDKAEIDIILNQDIINVILDKIHLIHCKQKIDSQQNYVFPNKWLLLYSILIPSKWLKLIGYTLSILTIIAVSLTNNNTLPLWLIIIVYFLSIILSITINAIYTISKFYNYTINKSYDCVLGISYGHLLKEEHFVLTDKINGILIKQDLINQITKTCRPYLHVAGYKNRTQELSLPFLPLAKTEKINDVFNSFLEDFHTIEKGYSPPPKAKTMYFLPNNILFTLLFFPLLLFFMIKGEYLALPIYILLQTIMLLNSRLAYKNTALFYDEIIFMAVKGGIFSSKFFCKQKDIQSISYMNTIFNRKKNVYKIKVFIKAVKGKSFGIGYIYPEN